MDENIINFEAARAKLKNSGNSRTQSPSRLSQEINAGKQFLFSELKMTLFKEMELLEKVVEGIANNQPASSYEKHAFMAFDSVHFIRQIVNNLYALDNDMPIEDIIELHNPDNDIEAHLLKFKNVILWSIHNGRSLSDTTMQMNRFIPLAGEPISQIDILRFCEKYLKPYLQENSIND